MAYPKQTAPVPAPGDEDPAPLRGVRAEGGATVFPALDDASEYLVDWALLLAWTRLVLGAPRRHPLLASLACAGVIAASIGVVLVVPRTYHTETKLLTSKNLVMPALGNPGRHIPGDADAPTRGAGETILRRENLLALVEQSNLLRQWDATRAPLSRLKDRALALVGRRLDDEQKRDALVYVLEKRLAVSTSGDTLTLEIDWPDAMAGYQLVTLAQQNFLETRHALEVSTIAEAISILEGHAAAAREKRDQALEEFRRAREAARESTSRAAAPAVARVRPRENPELTDLRLMLGAKRRVFGDLSEFRDRRLAELQARLAEQSAVYTPAHPAVAALRESIEALRKDSPQMAELRREERELTAQYLARGGQAADAERAEAGGESAGAGIRLPDVLKVSDASTEDSAEAQYWRTQLDNAIRKYDDLVARIDGARIELDTARAAFKYRYTVVRPAEVSKRPTKPKIPLVLAGGVLAGVVLAFGVSTLVDVRRGVILAEWQLERKVGIPVLARVAQR